MKRNNRKKKSRYALPLLRLTAAALMALAAVAGCGKKAPPVTPRQAPLAAVDDLKAVQDGETVTLTWHHRKHNRRATGYLVLRAQTPLSQPECPGCPQVFQQVERLSLSKSRRRYDHPLAFSQFVAKGFRYTFSVRPYQGSGLQGPDSNLVRIEGPPSERIQGPATRP